MDNKELRKNSENHFYVVIAKRDGVKKYVSRKHPNLFSYTVKLNEAMRFPNKDKANEYADFYGIELMEIRKVRCVLELLDRII